MIIAYQGIPGSFSSMAAGQYCSSPFSAVHTQRFVDLFQAVVSGTADVGVVPVENSLAGSVHENWDHLRTHKVHIIAEEYVQVQHFLGAKPGTRLQDISAVYSHPKALEQCQDFFFKHQGIQSIAFSDTAGAAQYVAKSHDSSIASISSAQAIELYGLQVIQPHLEDNPHNFTRFVVIASHRVQPKDIQIDQAVVSSYRGSVCFTLRHTPGSLASALAFFAQRKMNLTKIESRPIHGKTFEYEFFVEFESCHPPQTNMADFAEYVDTLTLLGIYPKNTTTIVA